MNGIKIIYLAAGCCFALLGCATTASIKSGDLGKSPNRNVVILGEHISPEVAQQYANEYTARVLFSPGRNLLSDAVSDSLRSVIGPSRAMRDLIIELKSLNNTSGEWLLIIPRYSERYFLVLLRNMEDNALSSAKGIVHLESDEKNLPLDTEVKRVSGGSFIVLYGVPELR
jgi:hypothetical protein